MSGTKRYHVNDDGNALECRVTVKRCPFKDFSTKEEARDHYERSQSESTLVSHTSIRKPVAVQSDSAGSEAEEPVVGASLAERLTAQSLSSKLTYSGDDPQWLKADKTLTKTLFGEDSAEPVIIDTVETPLGRAAVVWSENSTLPNDFSIQTDSGYTVSTLDYRHMKTGKVLGYVKMAYVSEEAYKRSFGDDEFSAYKSFTANSTRLSRMFDDKMVKVAEGYTSFKPISPYEGITDKDELVAKKREVWAHAHNGAGLIPATHQADPSLKPHLGWNGGLEPGHAPEDEKTLDSDLKEVSKYMEKEKKKLFRSRKNTRVDYSKLDPEIRGQGLGLSMYIYTARMLAKKDKMLTSSGLQSGEAQKLWKRIAEHPEIPTKMITHTYESGDKVEKSKRLSIDFRDR